MYLWSYNPLYNAMTFIKSSKSYFFIKKMTLLLEMDSEVGAGFLQIQKNNLIRPRFGLGAVLRSFWRSPGRVKHFSSPRKETQVKNIDLTCFSDDKHALCHTRRTLRQSKLTSFTLTFAPFFHCLVPCGHVHLCYSLLWQLGLPQSLVCVAKRMFVIRKAR